MNQIPRRSVLVGLLSSLALSGLPGCNNKRDTMIAAKIQATILDIDLKAGTIKLQFNRFLWGIEKEIPRRINPFSETAKPAQKHMRFGAARAEEIMQHLDWISCPKEWLQKLAIGESVYAIVAADLVSSNAKTPIISNSLFNQAPKIIEIQGLKR